jgi:hypothetical protein
MNMVSDTIKIDSDYYRECNKMPSHSYDYESTWHFDEECGLRYFATIRKDDDSNVYYMEFKVLDKQKYLLGKIKYGI